MFGRIWRFFGNAKIALVYNGDTIDVSFDENLTSKEFYELISNQLKSEKHINLYFNNELIKKDEQKIIDLGITKNSTIICRDYLSATENINTNNESFIPDFILNKELPLYFSVEYDNEQDLLHDFIKVYDANDKIVELFINNKFIHIKDENNFIEIKAIKSYHIHKIPGFRDKFFSIWIGQEQKQHYFFFLPSRYYNGISHSLDILLTNSQKNAYQNVNNNKYNDFKSFTETIRREIETNTRVESSSIQAHKEYSEKIPLLNDDLNSLKSELNQIKRLNDDGKRTITNLKKEFNSKYEILKHLEELLMYFSEQNDRYRDFSQQTLSSDQQQRICERIKEIFSLSEKENNSDISLFDTQNEIDSFTEKIRKLDHELTLLNCIDCDINDSIDLDFIEFDAYVNEENIYDILNNNELLNGVRPTSMSSTFNKHPRYLQSKNYAKLTKFSKEKYIDINDEYKKKIKFLESCLDTLTRGDINGEVKKTYEEELVFKYQGLVPFLDDLRYVDVHEASDSTATDDYNTLIQNIGELKKVVTKGRFNEKKYLDSLYKHPTISKDEEMNVHFLRNPSFSPNLQTLIDSLNSLSNVTNDFPVYESNKASHIECDKSSDNNEFLFPKLKQSDEKESSSFSVTRNKHQSISQLQDSSNSSNKIPETTAFSSIHINDYQTKPCTDQRFTFVPQEICYNNSNDISTYSNQYLSDHNDHQYSYSSITGNSAMIYSNNESSHINSLRNLCSTNLNLVFSTESKKDVKDLLGFLEKREKFTRHKDISYHHDITKNSNLNFLNGLRSKLNEIMNNMIEINTTKIPVLKNVERDEINTRTDINISKDQIAPFVYTFSLDFIQKQLNNQQDLNVIQKVKEISSVTGKKIYTNDDLLFLINDTKNKISNINRKIEELSEMLVIDEGRISKSKTLLENEKNENLKLKLKAKKLKPSNAANKS